MEKITRINGNGKPYSVPLPKIQIIGNMNDVALQHIFDNTGLNFKQNGWGYEAKANHSNQIVTLFLTYNFKTKYYNNRDIENTLLLKSDHNVGFNVDSICYNCAKENHINTRGLKDSDKLAC